MRWEGHKARIRDMINIHRILVGIPEGKREHERLRCRCEDNIKADLGDRNKVRRCYPDSSGSWQSPWAGLCKHGNEPSDFVKEINFLQVAKIPTAVAVLVEGLELCFLNRGSEKFRLLVITGRFLFRIWNIFRIFDYWFSLHSPLGGGGGWNGGWMGQDNQKAVEFNETHQSVVCADDINILGGKHKYRKETRRSSVRG